MKGECVDRDKSDLLATILPKQGKALIFPHEIFHEGSKILKGTKYILRTESKIKKKKSFFLIKIKSFVSKNRFRNIQQ